MPETTPAPTAPAEPVTQPPESATPPPADPTPAPTADPPEGGAPQDQDLDLDRESDVGKLRHEAATRRRQLRQVEAERDALRAQVDGFHRERVERIAGQRLADPSDLWTTVELAELRDEGGGLDNSKVRAAVNDVLAKKPHWAKPASADPIREHAGPRPPAPEPPSFGRELRRAIGRR